MTPPAIFVSYKSEDRVRVSPLVEGLRAAGLETWWDADIPGGESWRRDVQERLEGAGCVVVVWTRASVALPNPHVHDEASRARDRGVLLPVFLDAVTPPVGFGEVQGLHLEGWSGARGDRRLADVVDAARALLEGRRPPRPRPRRSGRAPRVWAGAGLALVVAFALDLAGTQRAVCRLPGIHSACGMAGLGGVPSAAEKADWAALDGSCAALRDHLARWPAGALREEAMARLATARMVEVQAWSEPFERRLPVVVGVGQEFGDEAHARADARDRAVQAARAACDAYGATAAHRVLEAGFEEGAATCRTAGTPTEFSCGLTGQATCTLSVRVVSREEVCGP